MSNLLPIRYWPVFFALLSICISAAGPAHTNALSSKQKQLQSPPSYHELKLISGSFEKPKLCAPLVKLLRYLQVPYEEGNLDSLMQALKARFDRGSKEIWEISDKEVEDKEALFTLLKEVGMLSQISPKWTHYDYAVVLGAICICMQKRLAHLDHLYRQGVRFDRIVLLSSERPLDPSIENEQSIVKAEDNGLRLFYDKKSPLPTTEKEAFAFYFKNLSLNPELKKIPCIEASATMEEKPPGHRRPSTADSVIKWLKTDPKPGKVLVITNQPYVGYQGCAVQHLLPKGFTVDTVGSEATAAYKTMTVLNALYRWLQTECVALKAQKELHHN